MSITILHGDCRWWMAQLAAESVDSIVCDPPYELGFMGKGWDRTGIANSAAMWGLALRVLKPGGHLLAFSGTRTYHRMVCAIEDAGFEIRDQIGDIIASDTRVQRFMASLDDEQRRAFMQCIDEAPVGGMLAWVYGSGFPKSLDVSKAIDKAAGIDREDKFEGAFERRAGPTGNKKCETCGKWLVSGSPCKCPRPQDEPQTDAARQWQGWGTALKPAWEPIVVARKPLAGTVAANVLAHGTGALNIDGCRVSVEDDAYARNHSGDRGHAGTREGGEATSLRPGGGSASDLGRWPANVIHDGSDEVLAAFPLGSTNKPVTRKSDAPAGLYEGGIGKATAGTVRSAFSDEGSAARFFYTAKASSSDRNEGLEGMQRVMPANAVDRPAQRDGTAGSGGRGSRSGPRENHHPTVKPTDLMRYLCRLVTPPRGTVLDPFMGSGSCGKAAVLEGFSYIGCELGDEYIPIAKRRISKVLGAFEEVLVRRQRLRAPT